MVGIKHILPVFLTIALLIGFSSCGTEESNNFSEVLFATPTSVKIKYNDKEYDSLISFDGKTLNLTVEETENSFGKLKFTADSEKSLVDYETLVKEFDTNTLPKGYLPKIIYDFFIQNGEKIVVRSTDEAGDKFINKTMLSNCIVKLTIYKNEKFETYEISIK